MNFDKYTKQDIEEIFEEITVLWNEAEPSLESLTGVAYDSETEEQYLSNFVNVNNILPKELSSDWVQRILDSFDYLSNEEFFKSYIQKIKNEEDLSEKEIRENILTTFDYFLETMKEIYDYNNLNEAKEFYKNRFYPKIIKPILRKFRKYSNNIIYNFAKYSGMDINSKEIKDFINSIKEEGINENTLNRFEELKNNQLFYFNETNTLEL